MRGQKTNHRGTEDTEPSTEKTDRETNNRLSCKKGPGMDTRDALTHAVIGAAIEVHRVLGPGLLESVYEECLCYELSLRGIEHGRQVELPVVYKAIWQEKGFRLDIFIPGRLVIEVKAVDAIAPIHEAQLLTYLRLTGVHVGLLLNFNVPVMKEGIKRMVL
jgi:GxxExxY protein